MKLIISALFLSATIQLISAGAPFIRPSPEGCTNIFDLFDPSTGAYIKTMCYVHNEIQLPEEHQYCIDNGMKLYTVDGLAELTDFYTFYAANMPTGYGIYVSGRRDDNGVWMTEYPTGPLFSGITITGTSSNKCLGLYIYNNQFVFFRAGCFYNAYFYCQYDKYSA